MRVFNNFLPPEQLKTLQEGICFNDNFPFHLQSKVAYDKEESVEYWNWYATHIFYDSNQNLGKNSIYYDCLNEFFIKRFEKDFGLKTLIRIKANMYPYTHSLKEHGSHYDYDYPNIAAIYSLNTCDGFTRFEDGIKMDSIENRLFLFDGRKGHNSSTTTNASVRFNINFNFTVF